MSKCDCMHPRPGEHMANCRLHRDWQKASILLTPSALAIEITEEHAKAALYGWCNADPATKVFSEYQIAALPAWKRALEAFLRSLAKS